MAKESKILTREQEIFLDLVAKEPYLRRRYYFTGGTPLAAFYLQHRFSEDIDLFSEQEVHMPSIQSFIGKTQKLLKLTQVDYRQFLGLHTFQLFFPNGEILKVDFNYYPFGRIEKGILYKGIEIDSVLDIATNKVHTIVMRQRARDFIDLYFIMQKYGFGLQDLLIKAKTKFDWHIDPVQLGSRLLLAAEQKDYPRMIKKIDHEEWKDFFTNEARKLEKVIFK